MDLLNVVIFFLIVLVCVGIFFGSLYVVMLVELLYRLGEKSFRYFWPRKENTHP